MPTYMYMYVYVSVCLGCIPVEGCSVNAYTDNMHMCV